MAGKKTSQQAGTREDRLKAALKANLARRKSQSRERAGDAQGQGLANPRQQGTKEQEKDA